MIQLEDIRIGRRIGRQYAPRVVVDKAVLEDAISSVELARFVVEHEEGLFARAFVHARIRRGRVQFILTTKKNGSRRVGYSHSPASAVGLAEASETIVDAMADWRL